MVAGRARVAHLGKAQSFQAASIPVHSIDQYNLYIAGSPPFDLPAILCVFLQGPRD